MAEGQPLAAIINTVEVVTAETMAVCNGEVRECGTRDDEELLWPD